jgi:hypothetical protein
MIPAHDDRDPPTSPLPARVCVDSDGVSSGRGWRAGSRCSLICETASAPGEGPPVTFRAPSSSNQIGPKSGDGECEVWVTFGTVRQKLLPPAHTISILTVLTPAHRPGVVDVTVETSSGLTVSLHAAVHNAGNAPIVLGDIVCSIPPSSICGRICGCGDTNIVEPHQTLIILETCHGWSHPTGLLVYIPREDGGVRPPLNFKVNVRDLNQADDNLGAQVPVVRERDLFDEPFNILFVPTDARYRLSLRVFHPDRVPEATVLVRIYRTHSDELLGETSVTLVADNEPPPIQRANHFVRASRRST